MKTTPLQTPIWALVLAMVIATVFLVPVGIITAVSNTTIGLNVLTEFVAGLLMPGKPIGNVTFKCFGYIAMSQALNLTSDLKLGWYTSIPPREMFTCQIIGTVLGALANCMCTSLSWLMKRLLLKLRCDPRIRDQLETGISRWIRGRSYRSMDWSSARDLLLRQYHLGSGCTGKVFQRWLRGAVSRV